MNNYDSVVVLQFQQSSFSLLVGIRNQVFCKTI